MASEKHTAGIGENGHVIGMANARRLAGTWDEETLLATMRSCSPRGKYAHFIRICRDELVRRRQHQEFRAYIQGF